MCFINNYRLGKVINNTYGSPIYSCFDRITNKEYACKVSNISFKDKLLNDERNVQKCNFPFINRIKHVYYEKQCTEKIIIMEKGEGDLIHYTHSNNMTEPIVKHFALQMTQAIQYLQKHKICHRDIKLENFIYFNKCKHSTDYRHVVARLIDFEFSKDYTNSRNNKMTEVKGTLGYIAPEILLNQPYTPNVDNWSLGISIYLMITNKQPFVNHALARRKHRTNFKPEYRFEYDTPAWSQYSCESKDFIKGLLQQEPAYRATITDCINHDWFKNTKPLHKDGICA